MRSARTTDRPSLLRRVAIASGLAAALGGLIAAATAGLTTRELVRSSDDAHTMAAASRLAEELDEEDEDDPLAEVIEEELDELDLPNARVALRERGALIAGDRTLPSVTPGLCTQIDAESAPLRVCAVTAGARTLIVGTSAARARAIQPLFLWGAALGVLLGSLAGALASARSARWALSPLDRLRAQIEAIDADAPRSDGLEPAEHAEIEALRAATSDLVDRLGAALGNAQRFALDAAHELRTPLTTVAGELELLAESDAPDPAALARARSNVSDLVALVQRLLVLAAPPVDTTGAAVAVDLADVAAEVLAGLSRDHADRVEVIAEDDVLVRGDAILLRIALGNAVENALKFSEGRVRVRIVGDAVESRMVVEDEGPGVPPSDRARVFEAFYRSAPARASASGHGLGLAIIAHVASGHGGHARFDDVARGARLCIALPRWQAR